MEKHTLPSLPPSIIGIDISLEVCKQEGYMMVELNGEFKPDKPYRVFAYAPPWQVDRYLPYTYKDGLMVDTLVSWDELKVIYAANRLGILSFSDDMDTLMNRGKASYYDLVQAASTINAYQGLP